MSDVIPSFLLLREQSLYAFRKMREGRIYLHEVIAISSRKLFIRRNCRWIIELYNDELYVVDPQSGWWERATCCACVILDPGGRPIRDDSKETCWVWHKRHAKVCKLNFYSNIWKCFHITYLENASHNRFGRFIPAGMENQCVDIDEIVTIRWVRSLVRHWRGLYRTRKLRCTSPFLPWKSLLSLLCVDRALFEMMGARQLVAAGRVGLFS